MAVDCCSTLNQCLLASKVINSNVYMATTLTRADNDPDGHLQPSVLTDECKARVDCGGSEQTVAPQLRCVLK